MVVGYTEKFKRLLKQSLKRSFECTVTSTNALFRDDPSQAKSEAWCLIGVHVDPSGLNLNACEDASVQSLHLCHGELTYRLKYILTHVYL